MKLTKKMRRELEDLLPDDLVVPTFAVLTYAVCSSEHDACGWGGWMLEAAFVESDSDLSKHWGGREMLSALTKQTCPACGQDLFRTDTAQLFSHAGNLSAST